MAVLIDTDLLVEHERTGWPVEDVVGGEEWAISVITVSELLHGVFRAGGARRARRTAFVEQLIAGAEAIPITAPIARVHAETGARLVDSGEPIGLHDLWIAATALAYGFGVATRNTSDFGRVAGLRVLSPP